MRKFARFRVNGQMISLNLDSIVYMSEVTPEEVSLTDWAEMQAKGGGRQLIKLTLSNGTTVLTNKSMEDMEVILADD